jgi:hypothetical protein
VYETNLYIDRGGGTSFTGADAFFTTTGLEWIDSSADWRSISLGEARGRANEHRF